jgi:hypothetical protein
MHLCLCLRDRKTSVVFRIGLILGAIVGNFADHFLGGVASRKGAFCVGPIRFGLAPVSRLHSSCRSVAALEMPGRIGRILMHREVAKVVELVGLLNGAHQKLVIVLSVCESWQAEHTGYVRRGDIAPKLRCQGP